MNGQKRTISRGNIIMWSVLLLIAAMLVGSIVLTLAVNSKINKVYAGLSHLVVNPEADILDGRFAHLPETDGKKAVFYEVSDGKNQFEDFPFATEYNFNSRKPDASEDVRFIVWRDSSRQVQTQYGKMRGGYSRYAFGYIRHTYWIYDIKTGEITTKDFEGERRNPPKSLTRSSYTNPDAKSEKAWLIQEMDRMTGSN